ncbi:MAG: cytochrome c oxidase subunit II [Parvibaculales bacterium]|jgi:cytochrome c oxidase subunit 2|nr:cytochrome c oxidase subunit II [Alphaproteobacteria bacterium]
MGLFKKISKWGAGLAAFSAAGLASAVAAQPKDWQITFQEAASENMTMITDFNNFLLILMTAISVFVLGLMLYVMVRFNARANPEPSTTTHNTLVEVVWTVVPIVILVVIAIPSFRLLYFQRDIPEADMTVKAVGYQWYWGYEYPDHGDFAFDSLMLSDEERGDQPRLLATDTAMVVPVDTTVRVIVTAADVLHAFAMPAFGLKMDAVPGRLNETWFKAEKTGTYYGQCSELCGIRHAFMPIRIEVVSKADFALWVEEAQNEYAEIDNADAMVASAELQDAQRQ